MIDLACPDIDRTGASVRAERRKAIVASFRRRMALLLVAFYGVPQIADRVAPLLPPRGRAAAGQRRRRPRCAPFSTRDPKERPFECGGAPVEAEGKKAFDKLMTEAGAGRAM